MTTPATLAVKGGGRFHLRRRLGEGSFGIVYEALDAHRNTVVALKTLRQFDAAALYRLKKEFRILTDVDHPNLVSLYELFAEGDEWFFTMELVDGVPPVEYVRHPPSCDIPGWLDFGSGTRTTSTDAPVADSLPSAESSERADAPAPASGVSELNRLRQVLIQLAEAICEIHEMGILHRDIKPSNVLVTPEGRVVLLDFGLVTELTDARATGTLRVVGTPAYMSPEQAAGQHVAEPSDWYAVGVMLYEALSGHLPFRGATIDMLLEKQRAEPPAPNTIAPDIPDDLNQLCQDLLRRDPATRPSGREVLQRIAAASSFSPELRDVEVARRLSSLLVGRDRQLAALSDAFRATVEGRAVMACIHGRSGMGKSALVRRFLRQLKDREPRSVILIGRCYEQESVPYKAVDGVVDHLAQYLKRFSAVEAARLLPRDVLALARLFPVLRDVEVIAGLKQRVTETADSQELRRRAATAWRELVGALADQRPVVMFIDDLQWGDRDSGVLLAELVRPPDPPPLLLIASYRSEERETSVALEMLLSKNAAPSLGSEVCEIEVGELTVTEARDLAHDLLAGAAHSAAQSEAIAQESGGSPFFVEELVRYALESGEVVKLDQVLQARVARLGGDARQLLELVSIAGQPLDLGVADRAASSQMDTHRVAR